MELKVRNAAQLGNAIHRMRKSLGWTQAKLGAEAGIKQSIVSSVEAGTPGTRLETLFKILTALSAEITVRERSRG